MNIVRNLINYEYLKNLTEMKNTIVVIKLHQKDSTVDYMNQNNGSATGRQNRGNH